MTYSTGTTYDFSPFERRPFSRAACPHTVSGAVALTLSMFVGGWLLYARSVGMLYAPPAGPSFYEAPPAVTSAVVVAPETPASARPGNAASAASRNAYGALETAPAAAAAQQQQSADSAFGGTLATMAASDSYEALLDPTYSLGSTRVPLSQSAPLGTNFHPLVSPAKPAQIAEAENVEPVPAQVPASLVQNIPLPTRRPAEFASPAAHETAEAPDSTAEQAQTTLVAPAPDNRSFFQKLFGMKPQPSGPELAYASSEDGVSNEEQNGSAAVAPFDHWTAVYDISAHTVYLPDGTRLEAHSGLGDALDDPRYVAERMRGPTPPGTYDLQPRAELFHGVQALRLIPVTGEQYGRAGLLAHTFMLGQNGDSFGCVSFRDYSAFLHAYESGEIKRITVVARLD